MPTKRSIDDLSKEELRQALIQRQRKERQERLRHYQKTGRALGIESPPGLIGPDDLRSKQAEIAERARLEKKRRGKKRWRDGFLLLIEVAAVAGLILLVINGVVLLQKLNREVAASLQQPTLTPTALIMAVVLPSGHTPPNLLESAQPGPAETLVHLSTLDQSIDPSPQPTSAPEQAIRIQIPTINVDAPIVPGDGWEQLKNGVGQHSGSANPGTNGNVILSAHNDVYGEIFKDLDQLKQGDTVILYTSSGHTYSYQVQEVKIVEPTSLEVLAQTDEPVLTLISCYPYMIDNQRIVVVATLIK